MNAKEKLVSYLEEVAQEIGDTDLNKYFLVDAMFEMNCAFVDTINILFSREELELKKAIN
jgi:hypothetical protein